MPHPLEAKYGLTSVELLDAIDRRFRLKVALEGAVAEVHFERKLKVGTQEGWLQAFEAHDLDGMHDFTVLAPSGHPMRVEVKTIRNGPKPRVEVQKTRNAKDDPSSRLYSADQFDVIAVCIGRLTGDWSQFRYAFASALPRHDKFPNKLKIMHDVSRDQPGAIRWFSRLQEVIDELDRAPAYVTALGAAYCADSSAFMRDQAPESVDLVVTSPPYALHFKKEYGNASQDDYLAWFLPFARQIYRVLKPAGSFVLNLGGAWQSGAPIRSLYHFRVVLSLCDQLNYFLAQEFFWFNPAKMPAPAEWVNVRRIRVKDSVEYIFWFTKDPYAKANNRRVCRRYSPDMKRLIKKGVKATTRPSGHAIRESFATDQGGAIPANVIQCGNNESNSTYIRGSKAAGSKIHPARFPAELPRFFIEFLTDPGDLVLDPFAGSNTTGAVAEELGRRWLSCEINPEYVEASHLRFHGAREALAEAEGQPSLLV